MVWSLQVLPHGKSGSLGSNNLQSSSHPLQAGGFSVVVLSEPPF